MMNHGSGVFIKFAHDVCTPKMGNCKHCSRPGPILSSFWICMNLFNTNVAIYWMVISTATLPPWDVSSGWSTDPFSSVLYINKSPKCGQRNTEGNNIAWYLAVSMSTRSTNLRPWSFRAMEALTRDLVEHPSHGQKQGRNNPRSLTGAVFLHPVVLPRWTPVGHCPP